MIYVDVWLVCGVASGIVFGVADVFTKIALRGRDSRAVVLGAFVWAALFWAPIVGMAQAGISLVDLKEGFVHRSAPVHALILIKALLLVSSSTAAFAAVQALPITISSALRSTGPLFVLVGSLIFIGSAPDGYQLLGIAMGVVSLLIYTWAPSGNGSSEAKPKYIILMLLAVVTAASSLVIDKILISDYGVNARMVQFHADIYRVVSALAIYLIVIRVPIRKSDILSLPIILAGILNSLGEFVYFLGVEVPDSEIAVLSMLRKFSLVVTFLAGVLFFRETGIARKVTGLSLLVASLLTIAASR